MFTSWRKRSPAEKVIVVATVVFLLFVVIVPIAFTKGPEYALIALVLIAIGLLIIGISSAAMSHLAVGVHEVGHYLAGKAVGFRFFSMKIGPFYWWKSDKGTQFSFRGSDQRAYGYVAMVPVDDRRLMQRYRLFILGGPVASLLMLLAVGWSVSWQNPFTGMPKNSGALDLVTRLLLLGLVIVTAMVALSSIVPFRYRGFYNDGALLLLSIFNKREAELRILLLKWGAIAGTGQRCSDWDIAMLRRILELTTAPFEKAIYGQNLGNALLYSGHVEEGLALLDQSYSQLTFKTGLMTEYECSLALDNAFARAYFGKNLEGARECLAKADEVKSARTYGFSRARAAIALLKGDRDEVGRHVEEARAWLSQHGDPEKDNIRASYEEMDRLIAEAGLVEKPPPPLRGL
jgi:hypothetical protein